MIKHGVLKLKRNKINLFLKKIALICGICFIAFTGCKTVPQVQTALNPVNTIDILDDEGAMYIHIPSEENRELLEILVSGFLKGISSNDAKLLVSKVDNVYVSFGSRKDKKRVQLALDGNIPGVTGSLLKNNGFEEVPYKAQSLFEPSVDAFISYKYYKSSELQISMPSTNQVIISRNVEPMIDQYNCERDAVNEIGGMTIVFEEPYRDDWKSTDLYQWISEDVSSIHFYIVRPQAFLSNLIGSDVSSRIFKLVFAKGNFSKLPNDKYELTLDLEFQNEKYVKPAISMLILTLGLTDSEIKRISPTHIQLTGVHMNTKQLTNMLGL